MIRLLVADDHAIVRTGLKQIFALVPDLEVVGEAENGGQVLERLRQGGVDLLMLDINMPGISGVDLILRLRAQHPDLPILVLSMHDEPSLVARVLKAGASGYVTKGGDLELLLPAIRKVAEGRNYISPDLAERMVFCRSSAAGEAPHLLLTEREAKVFRLLSEGSSVAEIATQLAISGKTVSTYKTRMMEKMNFSSMADLMRYAMQHELLN
jgi:DNA-binding NarL/FixJ family response regulator